MIVGNIHITFDNEYSEAIVENSVPDGLTDEEILDYVTCFCDDLVIAYYASELED